MKLKVTGKNRGHFAHTLTAVLNAASVMAMGGYIPDQLEMETPEQRGRYWFRDIDGKRYHLFPSSNDYWANIRDEGENENECFIVLEFNYRYDRAGNAFSDALTQLLAIRFKYAAVLVKDESGLSDWLFIDQKDYTTYPGEGEDVYVTDGTNYDVAYRIASGEYCWKKVNFHRDEFYNFDSFVPIAWKKIDK